MNGATDIQASLEAGWKELKAYDEQRSKFVENLLSMLQSLTEEKMRLKEEVDDLKFTAETNGKERRKLQGEIKSLICCQNAEPYVMALIDGDNTLFLDKYLQQWPDGGDKAADELHSALKEHLWESLEYQGDFKLVVHVYANLTGLAGIYRKSGIVEQPQTVVDFYRAFTRVFPLFVFVDVGRDKGAADKRIEENLELHMANVHCKRVILAGSADRDYVKILRAFTRGSDAAQKLELLEAVPFPADYKDVADRFKKKTFPGLFRNSSQLDPPPATTYAATVSPRPVVVGSSAQQVPHASTRSGRSAIKQNRAGQRLDDFVSHWNREVMERMQPRQLCHRHFLSRCDDDRCSYVHQGSLNAEEKQALKRLGRMTVCPSGTGCRDVHCVFGHCCPYDGNCRSSQGRGCRFGPEMHGIDKTPA